MRHLRSGLSIGAFLLLGACSTPPTTYEKFRELEGNLKLIFINLYPAMSADQRKVFLEHPEIAPDLLKQYRIKNPQDEMQSRKSNLLSIVIDPSNKTPITQGTGFHLMANAYYTDERKVVINPDVRWEVSPPIAEIKNSDLKVGCVHSDLTVIANFLDEAEGKTIYSFRKPLRSLYIQLTEASSVVDDGEFVQLRLNVTCEDETVNNVACETLWKIDPTQGKFLSCGHLHVTREAAQRGWVEITASYGDKTVQQKINLPQRFR